MSISEFTQLQETWQTLGEDDPLWAVASQDDKRGGRWELEEFLATGEQVVAYYHGLLQREEDCPPRFGHVLDFGCGVGRLCRAWSGRAEQVTGVDIAASMIEFGRRILSQTSNVRFVLNQQPDLRVFADGQFDLVTSHICLQHMPWSIAAKSLLEVARIAAPGGFVAVHLPAVETSPGGMARWRKRLVDLLPFGLAATYRRWRHGSRTVFDLYCTPAQTVIDVARAAGLPLRSQTADAPVPGQPDGFVYVFHKPRQP